MTLYALEPHDIADMLELARSPSLTITAPNAPRLAQLQQLLATIKPTPHEWHGCEECKARAGRMLEELAAVKAELEASARREQELAAKLAAGRESAQTDTERMHADDDMTERASPRIPCIGCED